MLLCFRFTVMSVLFSTFPGKPLVFIHVYGVKINVQSILLLNCITQVKCNTDKYIMWSYCVTAVLMDYILHLRYGLRVC